MSEEQLKDENKKLRTHLKKKIAEVDRLKECCQNFQYNQNVLQKCQEDQKEMINTLAQEKSLLEDTKNKLFVQVAELSNDLEKIKGERDQALNDIQTQSMRFNQNLTKYQDQISAHNVEIKRLKEQNNKLMDDNQKLSEDMSRLISEQQSNFDSSNLQIDPLVSIENNTNIKQELENIRSELEMVRKENNILKEQTLSQKNVSDDSEIQRLQLLLKNKNEELGALVEKIADFEKREQDFKSQIKEFKDQVIIQNAQHSTLSDHIKKLIEEKDVILNEKQELSTQLELCKADFQKNQMRLNETSCQLQNIQQELFQAKNEIDFLKTNSSNDEKAKYNSLLMDFENMYKSRENLLQQETQKLGEAKILVEKDRVEISNLKNELESQKNTIAEQQSKLNEEKYKFEQEKANFESLSKSAKVQLSNIEKMESEIKERENIIIQKEIDINEKMNAYQSMKNNLDKLTHDIESTKNSLQQRESELATKNHEYEKNVKQLELDKEENATEKARLSELKHNLSRVQKKQTADKQEIDAKLAKSSELEAQLAARQKEISEKEESLKVLENQLNSKTLENNCTFEKIRILENDLERKRKEIAAAEIDLQEQSVAFTNEKGTIQTKLGEIASLNQKITQLEGELSAKSDNVIKLSEEITDLSMKITEYETKIKVQNENIRKSEEKISGLELKNNELNKYNSDQQKTIEFSQNSISELEGKLNSLQESTDNVITDLENQIKIKDANIEKLEENIKLLNAEKLQIEENNTKLIEEINQANEQNNSLKQENEELSLKIKEGLSEIENHKSIVRSQSDQIADLEKAVADSNDNFEIQKKVTEKLELKLKEAQDAPRVEDLRRRVALLERENQRLGERLTGEGKPASSAPATPKKDNHPVIFSTPETKVLNKVVPKGYLKKLLLQFFLCEQNSERDPMVPIILKIAGCNETQITHAVARWREGQQLINKRWFF